MAKAVATRAVDLEPIDRLEEKVKLLVELIAKLRTEQEKTAEENARLAHEIEGLRERLVDAEAAGAEIGALRDERETIRTRVTEMLQQLDAI